MNTLETLLDRRWILKSRDRDLYYQVKDDLGGIRKFVTEKTWLSTDCQSVPGEAGEASRKAGELDGNPGIRR